MDRQDFSDTSDEEEEVQTKKQAATRKFASKSTKQTTTTRIAGFTDEMKRALTSSETTSKSVREAFLEAKKRTRIQNAEVLGAMSEDAIKFAAVTPPSQVTYLSNISRVVRRVIDGETPFDWTVDGLCKFMMHGEVAKSVNNNSCAGIISTFKMTYSLLNQDEHKQIGAINSERLQQLHEMYSCLNKNELLSDADELELREASTIMYAFALRVFQLGGIKYEDFEWKSERVAFISVPAKNTRQRLVETKVVHPDFVMKAKEILERRKALGLTCLFEKWKGDKVSGNFHSDRKRLEELMKNINAEAAETFAWPDLLEYHGTHQFRHGAAQDAFKAGGLREVMRRTGHLSEGIAKHYARMDVERQRDAKFKIIWEESTVSSARDDSKQKKINELLATFQKNIRETVDKELAARKLSQDAASDGALPTDLKVNVDLRLRSDPQKQANMLETARRMERLQQLLNPKKESGVIRSREEGIPPKQQKTIWGEYDKSKLAPFNVLVGGVVKVIHVPQKALDSRLLAEGMNYLSVERTLKEFCASDPDNKLNKKQ
jgi:hypothetical protein